MSGESIVDKITSKVDEAEELMKNQQFNDAKNSYLDAAEIALKVGKNQNSDKFKQLASKLIEKAKEIKENKLNQDLRNLNRKVEEKTQKKSEEDLRIKQDNIQYNNKFVLKETVDINYELPSKSAIEVPMGQILEKEGKLIWKPAELMNGFMIVTGGSGSGKTEWLKSISTELTNLGYPVVVIDLHGDIKTDIPTISIDWKGEFGINPLELISISERHGGPLPQINRLIKLFETAISDKFSATQKSYLRSLLHLAYQSAGIDQLDAETWSNPAPTFKFLKETLLNPDHLSGIDKSTYLNDMLSARSSTTAAVKNRLLPILEHPAFSAKKNIPIDQMFNTPIRIDIHSLQTVDMQFIVADTLLRHLLARSRAKGHLDGEKDEDKFRLFVIIDEIKILTGNTGSINDPFHILNRLATEGRKFGIGMILASQVIRHFSRDIRSNAASKIFLKPMDVGEAKSNAKELGIDHERLLDIDRPGRGYFKATNLDIPLEIQLYPIDERPIG